MKEKIKNVVKFGLKHVPLSIYQFVFPMKLTGFFYHAITLDSMPHVENLYQPITASHFENTLLELKKKYNFIRYGQIVDAFENGSVLPKNAAHLSFDDGFVENYTVVMPILERLEIPCMFFLTSKWIDNQSLFYRSKVSLCVAKVKEMDHAELETVLSKIDNVKIIDKLSLINRLKSFKQTEQIEIDAYCELMGIDTQAFLKERKPFLTKEQILEMHQSGSTFGGHSCTHRKFTQLPLNQVEDEIVKSCKAIQEITGQERVPFAFPNSATGFDRSILEEIRDRNSFLGLFFNSKGILPDKDFMFNRIWMERRIDNGQQASNWQSYVQYEYQAYAMEKLISWKK